MDSDSLASELRRALKGAVGLPVSDIDSIGVLIDVGEWQVALDTLCTQMYEYDVEVSRQQRSLLGRLGRVLDVPVGYLLGEPWASPANTRERDSATTRADVSRLAGPWVHRVRSADLSAIRQSARGVDCLVVELDGSRMRTVEALFREYLREFAFPEYFGWNWDAFFECMTGLEEKPARAYLTVVRNADQALADEPADAPIWLRQVEDLGRTWSRSFALGPDWGGGEVPFHTVLVDD